VTARHAFRPAPVLAGILGLLLLVTGCAIPSRPLWWPKPKKSAAAQNVDRAAASSSPALKTVAQPWHPGMRELGIQVYWTANKVDNNDALIRAKADRIINYAISLNANSIAVTFPFFTYGLNSDTLYDSQETPSPAYIGIFLQEAAKSHLRVTLRPILNENALVAQNPIAWRGIISPADRTAWFLSYRRLLLPFARVAQSGGAATFVVGTELDSLEGDPNWAPLITAIRSVYHGQLLYDENFNEFAAHNTTLPLSAFGVDAYPRFKLPDSTSVAGLTSAWDNWLGTHTAAVRHRAILSEVGIDAVSNSYDDPGAWLTTTTSPINVRVQTRWYEAVCRAVTTEHIGGVYWWEVSFDADPAHPAPFLSDRLTFLGRPAQQVIRNCFASLAGTSPGSG
jgi:hypothetical protein